MGRGGYAEADFVRPSVDALKYGFVELQNGLQAILICDEKTDKASGALDVSPLLGEFTHLYCAYGALPRSVHRPVRPKIPWCRSVSAV